MVLEFAVPFLVTLRPHRPATANNSSKPRKLTNWGFCIAHDPDQSQTSHESAWMCEVEWVVPARLFERVVCAYRRTDKFECQANRTDSMIKNVPGGSEPRVVPLRIIQYTALARNVHGGGATANGNTPAVPAAVLAGPAANAEAGEDMTGRTRTRKEGKKRMGHERQRSGQSGERESLQN